MNRYMKTLLRIGGFAFVLIVCIFLYNKLSESYGQSGLVDMQVEKDEGSIEAVQDADEQSNTAGEDKEVSMAVDFTVVNDEGEEVTLYSLTGKPIVLNFWASWCPPCINEMPDFQKVYEDLSDEVEFVMVNMTDGNRETQDKAKAFIDENGFTFPVYYDINLEAANAYYVSSIPTTYFIDAAGEIIAGAQGSIDEETLLLGIDRIRD